MKTPQDRLKIIQKIINGEDGNYDDNNSEINIRMVSCSVKFWKFVLINNNNDNNNNNNNNHHHHHHHHHHHNHNHNHNHNNIDGKCTSFKGTVT